MMKIRHLGFHYEKSLTSSYSLLTFKFNMCVLALSVLFFVITLGHGMDDKATYHCFRKIKKTNGLCYGIYDDTFNDEKSCCTIGSGFSDSLLRVSLKGYFCTPCPKPVDGEWGEWQPWAPCSASCGKGLWIRQRFCNNPSPSLGGKTCPPEGRSQSEECLIVECPVDGKWSQWGEFSHCSHSCGEGVRVRKRLCDNPEPNNGGEPCAGESEDGVKCYLGPCPINGGWSLWSHWSQCSASCGGGIQQRFRVCDNPLPQFNGDTCNGNADDIRECRAAIECPVHGHWSSWSKWMNCLSPDCILSQNIGFQYRYRACDNPKPQHSGRMCQESFIDVGTCFDPQNCPSDGQWSRWSDWDCVGSKMKRTRKCNNPPPRHGGKNCTFEDSVEEISKQDDPDSFSAVCGEENDNLNENAEGSGFGDDSQENIDYY